MPVVSVEAGDEDARTAHARDWLADAAPELSARTLLSKPQEVTAIALVTIVTVGLILRPLATGIVLVGLSTLVYVGTVLQRILMTARSLRSPNVIAVTDDEARAVAAADLPVYTVLVPIYKESGVLPALVGFLRALEYPPERLDVKLLVEANDDDTIQAAIEHAGDDMQVVVVPESDPRTKPKALNFGLTLSRGEFVTIYDAEDRPDPLQLRRAVVAFGRVPRDIGCLQAQLTYWNADQNLLTRWFSIEYIQWFRLLLPGLVTSDAPVPLGGTSNHMRRAFLDEIGGWDPYNVTEDADLGIRLHRAGYRSAVLESTTFEEANSDYVNWNNQRSRWYKGYLQTWLVHMRHPAKLIDELGWRGFAEFNAFVGGTPVLALLNLVFWALTIAWFVGQFSFIKALFPTVIYYPALFCFVFGNFTIAYLYVLAARLSERPALVWAALGVPIYWLMMGIAALKAFWQVATARSFWEKTVHGLDADPAAGEGDGTDSGGAGTSVGAGAVAIEVLPFAAPAAPELATRIEQGSKRGGVGWPSRMSRVLQWAGYVLMAFVVYILAFSGLVSGSDSHGKDLPERVACTLVHGAPLARIRIPSVAVDELISEGTGAAQLRNGLGHLRGTALPGAAGEAVIIGPRVARGGSLRHLANVRPDDQIFLRTGSGGATYRVESVTTRSREEIEATPDGPERLLLVTGTSGVNPSRLLVVQARVAGENTIRFEGAAPPYRGIPKIPGVDRGDLAAAFLCLVLAVVVLRSRRRVGGSGGGTRVSVVVGIAVAVALLGAFVAATQALPPTF